MDTAVYVCSLSPCEFAQYSCGGCSIWRMKIRVYSAIKGDNGSESEKGEGLEMLKVFILL